MIKLYHAWKKSIALECIRAVNGGHIAAVVEQIGMESSIDHISTDGGACIDILAGRNLPGIEALEESTERYQAK